MVAPKNYAIFYAKCLSEAPIFVNGTQHALVSPPELICDTEKDSSLTARNDNMERTVIPNGVRDLEQIESLRLFLTEALPPRELVLVLAFSTIDEDIYPNWTSKFKLEI
jgi:hypothetical protein